MRTYADSQLVDVYADSPDRQAARKEARHPTDPDDTDRNLDHQETDDETIDAQGIRGIPKDALGQLLRFLLPVTSKPGRWQMASVRLAVICRILNIDDLGKLPLEQLAKQLGVTRSLLSLRQLEVADQYGLGKLRSSKSAAARKNYSTSATNAHRRAQERREAAAGNLTHKATAASL